MVKVVWQESAKEDLRSVCYYYRYVKLASNAADRIKSEAFAAAKMLETFPRCGAREMVLESEPVEYRYLVVAKHYKLIYFVENNKCNIVTFWDCRNNPEILKNTTHN